MPRIHHLLGAALAALVTSGSLLQGAQLHRQYQFTTANEPALRYSSGDILFELAAEVAGGFTLTYDDQTGAATLSDVTATVHSAQLLEGFPAPWVMTAVEEFNGKPAASVVYGLFSTLEGQLTSPNMFSFGPGTTPDSFDWSYSISIDGENPRLDASSVFDGDDGPTITLHAALVAIPEPTTWALILSFSLCGSRRRQRS